MNNGGGGGPPVNTLGAIRLYIYIYIYMCVFGVSTLLPPQPWSILLSIDVDS